MLEILPFTKFWNTSWKSVYSFAKPVRNLFLYFEILGSRQFSSSTLKYVFYNSKLSTLFGVWLLSKRNRNSYSSAVFFKAKQILDSKKMKAVCVTWALASSKSLLSCTFSFLGWSCYWAKYCLSWKVIYIWSWLLGFGFR